MALPHPRSGTVAPSASPLPRFISSQLFRLFLNHSPKPLDNLRMSRPKQIDGVVYNVGKVALNKYMFKIETNLVHKSNQNRESSMEQHLYLQNDKEDQ